MVDVATDGRVIAHMKFKGFECNALMLKASAFSPQGLHLSQRKRSLSLDLRWAKSRDPNRESLAI